MTPTVLLSDDEPLFLTAFSRMGRRHGLNVVCVQRPQELLATASALMPDLILLDITQPIDGRDLLAALKKNQATHDIPVLIISGSTDQFLRHTCFELGAVDFEEKPFDIGTILKALRTIEASHESAGSDCPGAR